MAFVSFAYRASMRILLALLERLPATSYASVFVRHAYEQSVVRS
jgi:hypothetical protein